LVLTGMLVANTIHMINHAVDLSLGGGHAATAGGPGRADRDRAETSWAAAPQRRRPVLRPACGTGGAAWTETVTDQLSPVRVATWNLWWRFGPVEAATRRDRRRAR
jgi:hypothetical protein